LNVPIDSDPDSDTDLDEACFPKYLSLSWFAFFAVIGSVGDNHTDDAPHYKKHSSHGFSL